MDLYFYEECEFSQIVLHTISSLKIEDKINFKDIRLNLTFLAELKKIAGSQTVPCLNTKDGFIKESIEIRRYLLEKFK